MSGLKWTRRATRKIQRELRKAKIKVSRTTIARVLKDLGYSLRANRKMIATTSSPHRNRQFLYIREIRALFEQEGLPVISVDTKKKENLGCFKNPGVVWGREPIAVNDHDFKKDSVGTASPYGIYDVVANRAHVFVGTSHDTPAFAVDSVAAWWGKEGRRRYPRADNVLILADNGGSNGPRLRVWKRDLQRKICDRFQIGVTVCHYPPGASKWNPIEHRCFSEITKNWGGCPLESHEVVLKYIRRTTTTSGLHVRATLVRRYYRKGVRVPNKEMEALNLYPHPVLPCWNYSLLPTSQVV